MFFNRYLLHSFLLLTILMNPLSAHESSVTYEKFYRLNSPLYRSDSGDLINFSYESGPIDNNKKLDVFGMGDLHLYFQDNDAINYSLQEGYARYKGDAFQLFVGFI